jgi:hypothetical protein
MTYTTPVDRVRVGIVPDRDTEHNNHQPKGPYSMEIQSIKKPNREKAKPTVGLQLHPGEVEILDELVAQLARERRVPISSSVALGELIRGMVSVPKNVGTLPQCPRYPVRPSLYQVEIEIIERLAKEKCTTKSNIVGAILRGVIKVGK